MTYRGHIEHGVVVLEEPLELPEGTAVEVDIAVAGDAEEQEPATEEEVAALMRFAGTFKGLPPDASVNLKHYLYGHPKQ